MKGMFGFGHTDLKKKADEHIIKGNWAKALTEYEKIVEADPSNIRNRQKLGDIYAKLNKKEEAIEEYTGVAESYANEGFLIKAIAINKLIVKLDPENVDVQEKLADLYSSRGIAYGSQKKVEVKESEKPKKKSEEPKKEMPKVPLFSDLSHEEFCKVVSKLKERHFKPGDVVCNEGDEGDSIYIISEGNVVITKKDDATGEDVPLAQLTDGAFFGEFAFFSNSKRQATVTADKDTLIFEIIKNDINEIIKDFPRVEAVLQEFYKERVVSNLLAMSPIFGSFNEDEKKKIISKFVVKEYKENDDIVKEGEAGASIFLIKSGKVKVSTRKDEKLIELAELTAGDFFGEVAIVTGQPRTATVTAVTKVEVGELLKEGYDDISAKHPEMKAILTNYLQERAKSTVDVIISLDRKKRAKKKLV